MLCATSDIIQCFRNDMIYLWDIWDDLTYMIVLSLLVEEGFDNVCIFHNQVYENYICSVDRAEAPRPLHQDLG